MGLSITQRFLVGAVRAAGAGEYFRWQAVGTALGFSAEVADRAVRSLDERKLVMVLAEGQAKLLGTGRRLAGQLEAKEGARAKG